MTEKKRGMLYFCGLQTLLLEIRVKAKTKLFNERFTVAEIRDDQGVRPSLAPCAIVSSIF
ncbi:hypothetical protein [uncultured Acetobacterium sp.]|uniref:hypothetical protein n=1 Tax=uncultured Acetobacterium sp. TaxID=217139 RepID=UPI0025E88E8E|nr:hypothetical protein [uncultured Acetobacterium sp.]